MHDAYDSLDHAWREILRALLSRKPSSARVLRDGEIARELLSHSFTIDMQAGGGQSWLTNERRRLNPGYACAEVLWLALGCTDTHLIARFAPSFEARYCDGKPYARWAYGPRIMGALPAAIARLGQHSNSSRACVQCFDTRLDLVEATENVLCPCTLNWQFFVRDDKLHMIETARASDAWVGLPNDVFVSTCFMRVVAWELGLELGGYHRHAGTLHLYERHLARAIEALGAPDRPSLRPCPWKPTRDTLLDLRTAALSWDRYTLSKPGGDEENMVRDLVKTCRWHAGGTVAPIGPPAWRVLCT
jgi:thymidylate synthase